MNYDYANVCPQPLFCFIILGLPENHTSLLLIKSMTGLTSPGSAAISLLEPSFGKTNKPRATHEKHSGQLEQPAEQSSAALADTTAVS